MTSAPEPVAPVLLVTGTSTGIGAAAAVAAARAGFTVIATMRDTGKSAALEAAAEASGVTLDVRRLDITDAASIDACIADVQQRYGRLDALVNNAGAGHVGTLEAESIDTVRGVMEVNFFGTISVTRAALPLLRASRGRLIVVTSVGGIVGQPFNEAYCAAKFAVEGFFESLTPVVAAQGVRVTLVEPGAVATEFVANIDADDPVAGTVYTDAYAAYRERTAVSFSPENAQTPDAVADAIVGVLTTDAPPARVQTSENARRFAGVKLADLDGSAVQAMTSGWIAAQAT